MILLSCQVIAYKVNTVSYNALNFKPLYDFSANPSKAAWGGLEKKGTQLKIPSYEIGMLFTTKEEVTNFTLRFVAGIIDGI